MGGINEATRVNGKGCPRICKLRSNWSGSDNGARWGNRGNGSFKIAASLRDSENHRADGEVVYAIAAGCSRARARTWIEAETVEGKDSLWTTRRSDILVAEAEAAFQRGQEAAARVRR